VPAHPAAEVHEVQRDLVGVRVDEVADVVDVGRGPR
jgi:hypothetical protein